MKPLEEAAATTLEMVLLYPTADFYFGHGLARHGKLKTIDLATGVLALQEEGEGIGYTYKHFSDCMIELLPFAALCTPLEDGTGREIIPAVEALRLALGWPNRFYRDRFTAKLLDSENGDCCVRIESYSDDSGGWIRFNAQHNSWLFDGFDNDRSEVVNPQAGFDYLRRNHFAVGLKPSDYLPK